MVASHAVHEERLRVQLHKDDEPRTGHATQGGGNIKEGPLTEGRAAGLHDAYPIGTG